MMTEANLEKVILVVEDEQLYMDIVRLHLDQLGYKILEARNGQQALAIVDSQHIDLIISDIQMPVLDGIDLLREIRHKSASNPPFVFMTSFADISSEEALGMGAEAFLRKPLVRRDLIEVVEKALVPRVHRWGQKTINQESARCFDFTTYGNTWQLESQPSSSVEIGQGGMFLPVLDDYPSGFEVFRFKVDTGDSGLGVLNGFGQVRWVRNDPDNGRQIGIGVEFLELDESSRVNILNHLQEYRPRSYIPLGFEQWK